MSALRLAALVTVATAAASTAAGLLGGACGRQSPSAPPEPTAADRERGAAVVARLKGGLVGALTRAMADGGAPAALTTCSTEAPAIAASFATDGVTVGRVTRKPRNPANLAAGWQADALAGFEADVAAGRPLDGARFARTLPGGRVGYAEPLVIQPLCLTCHGSELAPDVSAALAVRYPDDRATGYRQGDLRGVVWVELPPAAR